jgi:hypothetical protein
MKHTEEQPLLMPAAAVVAVVAVVLNYHPRMIRMPQLHSAKIDRQHPAHNRSLRDAPAQSMSLKAMCAWKQRMTEQKQKDEAHRERQLRSMERIICKMYATAAAASHSKNRHDVKFNTLCKIERRTSNFHGCHTSLRHLSRRSRESHYWHTPATICS